MSVVIVLFDIRVSFSSTYERRPLWQRARPTNPIAYAYDSHCLRSPLGAPTPSTADGPIDWFPNRSARRPAAVNPETLWLLVTSHIAPDLMDALVQTYLSTSYYLMPFLHIPTFLKDYGNPAKWGEPVSGVVWLLWCWARNHTEDDR